MKISILVPTLGTRSKELIRLFESINQQTYKDIEVIVVTQGNHDVVCEILNQVKLKDAKQVKLDRRGLSIARNEGLKYATGDIVVLSDDDCWYPVNAIERISDLFSNNPRKNILLTQIFDPNKDKLYKDYPKSEGVIKNKIELLRKSSIEITFRRGVLAEEYFDERLGLGGEFCSGEEVDFLIRNFIRDTFYYVPQITVYHLKKYGKDSKDQVKAKGALYGKHFNIAICLAVLIRDLLIKRENNFMAFYNGYMQYKEGKL